ncbi:Dehydratase medium subunit [Modestobacter sp. DSM 44400]|uniref:glycerol dehydratase reactivase beta/small subunit family protein n=1 Tax=Modestobacter sp. DSM 44400 TaxID=1550230 RepID=UPI00089A8DE3|nr:glycerol dehydratase reactivase beta/small subunit family protein [Modestobacter sp. DSM 44400]SDY57518.1 Dehydratase medium subunit [Modestobacter sp. DSM 44400]
MTGSAERPAVLVYRHPGTPPAVLRQVCAGAEEEGVPTEVVDAPDGGDATALAHAAAQASRLDVGIGLDASGAAAVHHGKLPERGPAATTGLDGTPADWRRAGRTAARVVKGLPLG